MPLASAADVRRMPTSFETYDALLTAERRLKDATQIVRQLAAAALERPWDTAR